jgi:hypothetical protein
MKHGMQELMFDLPGTPLYVPFGHSCNALEPKGQYAPGRHVQHAVALPTAYDPPWQATGATFVVLQNEPAGHHVHDEAAPNEY